MRSHVRPGVVAIVTAALLATALAVSRPKAPGEISTLAGPPDVTINDVTVAEGDSGTSTASFTVTLSASAASTVTVNYATANATATSGTDYVAASGTVSFAPGETSKPIAVTVNGDTTYELTETYAVGLSGAVNANLLDASGLGTITNDDAQPDVWISNSAATEGNSGTVNQPFTINLTHASYQTVVVSYRTSNGTATTANSDYVATATEGNIASGASGLGNDNAVAVDAAGNRYVVDTTGNRVRKVTLSGVVSVVAGTGTLGFSGDGGAATSATMFWPGGDAISPAGNLYVADSGNNRVRMVNLTTGIITTVVGTGTAGFSGDSGAATAAAVNQPTGLAFDTAGNLYIADTGNHRIRKVAAGTGIITTVAGTGAAGSTGDGGAATSAAIGSPMGIAFDPNGNFLFVDNATYRVRRVAISTGVISTIAGTGVGGFSGDGGAATSAQLNAPVGIAIDQFGCIFVSDTNNQRVRKINPAGVISTVAGTGTAGLSGDGGPGTSAQLNNPKGLAVDTVLSRLVIADSTNARLRDLLKLPTVTFVPGETTKNPTVGIIGDTTFEVDETFTISPVDTFNATTTAGSGTFTILNDELAFSVSDASITEGDTGSSTMNFTVSLPVASASTISVNYATANVNAVAGSDYAAASGTLTFTPGQTSQTVPVTILNDTWNEGQEWFYLNLSSPVGAPINDGQGRGVINDNDPYPYASITDSSVAEGNTGTTPATFTVSLSAPSGNTVTLDYSTVDGTATAGSDFTGQGAGTISTIAGTGLAAFSGDGGAGALADVDSPNGVALDAAGNVYVADSNNSRIRRIDASTGVITTVAGTGTAGYAGDGGTATTAQLRYPQGVAVDSSGDVYIGDSGNNRIRKVTVATGIITTIAGTGTAGSTGDGGPATAALLNNPWGVAVDVNGNVLVADRGNRKVRKITASTGLMSTAAGTGSAGYSGDGGAATAAQMNAPVGVAYSVNGHFYVADRGNSTVRWVNGFSGVITTIAGTGSAGFSGDGGAGSAAQVSAPMGVAVSGSTLWIADTNNNRIRRVDLTTGTITTVAGTGAAGFSGDGGTAPAALLNGPFGLAVDATGGLRLTDTLNNRVRRIDGTTRLTFAPGETLKTLTVPVFGDTTGELDETYSVVLSSPVNTGVSDGTGVGTIVSDDAAISVGDVVVAEGNNGTSSATFIVSLGVASPSTITVDYATVNGTATAGSDYVGASGTLTFAPGQTSKTVPVTVNGDLAFEPDETFRLNLSNAVNAPIVDSLGTATIVNDEAVPALSVNDVTVNEGNSGTSNATFTVSLASSFDFPVSVDYVTAAGTATAGTDYTNVWSSTIDTYAGTGSATFGGDGGTAAAAQVNAPTGVALDAAGNLYIADRSNHRIRKVTAATGIITTIAGTGTAGFSGDGGAATAAKLDLPVAVAVDASGNVYISDLNNDRIRKVTAATGIITTIAGTGTFGSSGDGGPATSAQLWYPVDLEVDGNGNVVFADQGTNRVRKITAATGIITTIAGTGAYGYSGDGGPATAAALKQPAGVALDSVGNLYIADSSNYRIREVYMDGTIATIAGTGTAGYSGDGGPATAAQIELADDVEVGADGVVYVADSNNHVLRAIDRTGRTTTVAGVGSSGWGGDGGPATNAYLSYPGGVAIAPTGMLYVADTGSNKIRRVARAPLTFAPGETTKTVSIPIIGDTTPESDETFTIQLVSALNAPIADGSGLGAIRDDERTVSIGSATLIEGNSGSTSAAFTATLSSASLVTVSVGWATTDGSAKAGAGDYTASSGTATFAPGETTKVISVPVTGDTLFEGTELFGLTLSSPVNVVLGSPATGLGTILDDDTAPVLSIGPGTATEGDSGTSAGSFPATLSAPAGLPVWADVTATNGTATAGSDFSVVPTIGTVAGTGTAGYAGEAGPATSAQLNAPNGLAVDAAGAIYVADKNNHRVRRVATDGTISTIAGTGTAGYGGDGGPATSAQLNLPSAVAVDAAGNVYLADSTNYRVRRIDASTGTISTIAGTGASGFGGDGGPATSALLGSISGLALDSFGNLYLVDTTNNRIRRVGTDGVITTVAGKTCSFVFFGDCLDPLGDGGPATNAILWVPVGVAVDGAGNLLIADQGNSKVRKVTGSTGVITTLAGIGGVQAVAVDAAGTTYASRSGYVYSVSPAGAVSTLAGTGVAGFSGDGGPAGSAQVSTPYGLATDMAGNLLVADTGNHRIRKVTFPRVFFAPGQAAVSGTVAIVGDSVAEPTETFTLTASNPFNATLGTSVATETIIDNDIFVSIGDATVGEGNAGTTTVVLPVSIPFAAVATVSAGWSTGDGSATSAGGDYSAASGTVAITPGQTSATVSIAVNGDTLHEANETVLVKLSSPGNGVIVDTQGVVTIADDDAAPTLSVDDVSWPEGNSGSSVKQATVSLSAPSGLPVLPNLSVAPGTATAGSDYLAPVTSATINALAGTGGFGYAGDGGQATNAQFRYPDAVLADSAGNVYIADTNNHRVRKVTAATGIITTVAGTGIGGYSGDGGPATSAQLNSPEGLAVDVSGNLFVADTSNHRVRRVDAGTGVITTLTGTGTAGYSGDGGAPSSAQLRYPTGVAVDPEGNIYIADHDNNRIRKIDAGTGLITTAAGDGSYGYGGDGGAATSASLKWPTGVATDAAGNLFVADTYNNRIRRVDVGTGVISTVAGSGAAGYDGDGGAATSAQIYTPYGVASDPAGNLVIADTGNHRIRRVDAGTGLIGTIAGTGTFGSSGDGGPAASCRLNTPIGVAMDAVGNVLIADTYNQRIRKVTHPVIVAPGVTTASLPVTVFGDSTFEPNETVLVTINQVQGATVADGSGVATIVNDDVALSITDQTVIEGDAGTTTATFTISLPGASFYDVTVNWATSDNSAAAGSDYTAASGTATIPAGSTSTTVTVGVAGDATPEPSETFTVTLSNPTGATIADGSGIGTIANDDAELSIADRTVAEGDSGATSANFTVSIPFPTVQDVTVDWATADGTAADGDDYTAASGTATIPAGSTIATFTVAVLTDTTPEPYKSFTVTLSNPTGATIADGSGMGTIANDDAVITVSDASVAEGDDYYSYPFTEVSFQVSIPYPSVKWVGASYSTASGTATAGSDFVAIAGSQSMMPGLTSMRIRVPVIEDTMHESDETFTLSLITPYNATVSDGNATGTILNDDAIPVLTVYGNLTVEGDPVSPGYEYFVVSLSNPSDQAITFDWATSDGDAIHGEDYAGGSGTVTIAAGDWGTWVGVDVVGDSVPEPYESFGFAISNPTNATIDVGSASGEIWNDDAALSVGDVSVTEGNGGTSTASFTVSTPYPFEGLATVDWATADGTATAGDDYTAASGTIDVSGWDTSKTVVVTVAGDTLHEPDESFTVSLSNPAGATIADGTGVGIITNDDDAPALSIGDRSVVEGDAGTTMASFTVSIPEGSSQDVSVDWAMSDGSATAGSDYTAGSGTVTIPAGSTTATVDVAVAGDTGVEPDESFTVTLSNPVNATVLDPTGVGTIRNDDAVVSIGDVSVTEGDSGTVNASFTVSIPYPSVNAVTVDWVTSDGTATSGSDYTAGSGTVIFVPGETSTTVSVLIDGDTTFEADETFTVALSNQTGSILGATPGTGTITNDDSAPVVSIGDATVSEGNTSTANAEFTVALSNPSASMVTVEWATVDGTATGIGNDYTAGAGTLTFLPGETSKVVSVTVDGDTTFEADETFTVGLSNQVGSIMGASLGTGTILNDDTAPSVSVNSVSVTEGVTGTSNADFTVSLSVPSGLPVTVDWATADGTATSSDDDYVAGAGTVTFAPGETIKTVDVTINGDTTFEADETFTVALSNQTGSILGATPGTGTITNDDAQPTISVNSVSVTEGNAGTTNADFTVSLSNPSASTVSVEWATADGSATTAAGDYAPGSGTVTLAPGETSKTVAVTVNGDTTFEGDETFTVGLTNPSGASVGTSPGTGTILNDDGVPSVSVDSVSVTEGNSGTTTATFTVSLSNPSAFAVLVDWATADGTATTADSDYGAGSGTLTFLPGETSKTVSVTVNGDTLFEGDETFTVGLSNPSGASVGTSPGTGTITNDDTAPSVSVDSMSVTEGNSGTTTADFTVSLSAASGLPVSVDWATADGSATTADNDYAAGLGTVTFAPGETSKTVSVTVNGDTTYEGDETFTVGLSNPVGATVGTTPGTGTILDDDAQPSVSVNDTSVTEGNSGAVSATFTVSLSNASASTVTVNWATADGTAKAGASPATWGSDYAAGSGTVTFLPGETSKSVSVTVNGDVNYEPDETFTVGLTNPSGATIGTSPGTGTISTDDETIYVDTTADVVDATPGDHYCRTAGDVCSFRAAVQESNSRGGVQPIVLQTGALYRLTVAGAGEDASATGDLDVLDNTTITGNGSTLDAAGIDRAMYVAIAGGSFSIDHLTITGGNPPGPPPNNIGAGILTVGGVAITLDTVTVTGNTSGYAGGGLLTTNTGGVVLRSSTISNNSAIAGGGMASLSPLTVTDSVFSGNTGTQVGGGLLTQADASLTNVEFTGNRTDTGGAGIFHQTGMFTMVGGSVHDNAANGVGGGMALTDSASLTDVVVERNTAAFGGGICLVSGTLTMTRGRVADNHTTQTAGGLLLESNASLTDVVVEQNTGLDGAGAIVLLGTVSVTGGAWRNNTASRNGGGLVEWSGSVTMNGVSVTGNSAEMGGGLILTGAASVSNSTVSSNSASLRGGGVFLGGTDAISITGSTISGNTSPDAGAVFAAGSGPVTVTTSEISGNTSTGASGMGPVAVLSGSMTISRSTLAGNSGYLGGALLAIGAVTMDRSTVSGNSSAIAAVMVLASSGGTVTARDTTITANTGPGLWSNVNGAVTLRNSIVGANSSISCIGAVTSNGYNLASDGTCGLSQPTDLSNTAPNLGALANNGGPTRTHLPNAASPAVDTGDPACLATDQRGNTRPNGAACDRGAVER